MYRPNTTLTFRALASTVAWREAHLIFASRLDSPFEVYVDSSWEVKFSSSGAMFFYAGCLIAWFSKVQRSVAFSSAEAELFGAILAAKEGIFCRDLLLEFGMNVGGATTIFTDSKS